MNDIAVIQIAKSLSKKSFTRLVLTWGPQAIIGLYTMLNQRKEGKAAAQKEMTYRQMQEAIPKLLESIEQKEIRLVPNAFNSNPEFIAYFQASAIGAVPLILLDLAQSIRRIGASLGEIKSELAISNIARVQGWADDGFGTYVHRFVQNEMAPTEGRTRRGNHFFYVWNPDSDWYPDFERRQRQDPQGPNFGGYHHDLATICLRMRADRRTLIATTDYSNNPVFHLIIPTYYPLVIGTLIAFAEELLPLIITGSRHRGTDLVWFNLDGRSTFPIPQLEFIGVLPLVENRLSARSAVVFMSCCFGAVASGIAAAAFPPCAAAAEVVLASCWTTGMASGLVGNAAQAYERRARDEVQVLGDALFLI